MSSKVYADVVVGVPYGNEGKRKWVKIGAMLKMDKNDPDRGPGFVIMLDRYINLAGFPTDGGEASVAASTFWPKDKPQQHTKTSSTDDDTPF